MNIEHPKKCTASLTVLSFWLVLSFIFQISRKWLQACFAFCTMLPQSRSLQGNANMSSLFKKFCMHTYGCDSLVWKQLRISDTQYWHRSSWVVMHWEDDHTLFPHPCLCVFDSRCTPVLHSCVIPMDAANHFWDPSLSFYISKFLTHRSSLTHLSPINSQGHMRPCIEKYHNISHEYVEYSLPQDFSKHVSCG